MTTDSFTPDSLSERLNEEGGPPAFTQNLSGPDWRRQTFSLSFKDQIWRYRAVLGPVQSPATCKLTMMMAMAKEIPSTTFMFCFIRLMIWSAQGCRFRDNTSVSLPSLAYRRRSDVPHRLVDAAFAGGGGVSAVAEAGSWRLGPVSGSLDDPTALQLEGREQITSWFLGFWTGTASRSEPVPNIQSDRC